MKVIVTQKQLEQIRENASKKFSCEGKNCEHSWDIKKEDKHPYLCHMCGYDSHKEKHNYDELENFWKNYKKEEVTEKLLENKETDDRLKSKYGYDIEKIKIALKLLSQISDTIGEGVELEFKLYGYDLKTFSGGSPVLILFIDVDTEDGVYNTRSENWYYIGMELLEIFQMLDIRDEKYMRPMYDFKFNKKSLEGMTIV